MLVTFRSKAAGEIYMYAEHAKMLLDIVGKDFDPPQAPRGVFTVEQLPAAVAALQAASERSKQQDQQVLEAHETGERKSDAMAMPVGLSQRAFPLLDMLERAQKKGVVVTWGV